MCIYLYICNYNYVKINIKNSFMKGWSVMGVCYNKLFKLMIDKKIKKTELASLASLSPATLAKLSKDEFVSMDVLVRICGVLDCDIGDIVEVTENETGENV